MKVHFASEKNRNFLCNTLPLPTSLYTSETKEVSCSICKRIIRRCAAYNLPIPLMPPRRNTWTIPREKSIELKEKETKERKRYKNFSYNELLKEVERLAHENNLLHRRVSYERNKRMNLQKLVDTIREKRCLKQ